MENAPRAFVSHASEDKDRFVANFARLLRQGGIDAWYDQWEILPGDSLVQRIFDEGIAGASVFIVVISKVSAAKPWVAEELDAGVVRRITKGTRLIPIRLDDAEIPAALKHLKYLDADELGVEGVVDAIVATVFEQHPGKPPIGDPPGFATRRKQRLADPVDDAVLAAIIELAAEAGEVNLGEDKIVDRLASTGLTSQQIHDGIESLISMHVIGDGRASFGGLYYISKIAPSVWLDAARARGVDVDRAYVQLLRLYESGELVGDVEGLDDATVDALTQQLVNDGHIRIAGRTFGGTFAELTVGGRRFLSRL
jgi:hypothetical protein